jgi:hypothetical protein
MKLFGVPLPFAFKEETKKKPRSLVGELGQSGTNIWNGLIDEEYNRDLQGDQGYEAFDKMRRSDGTVQAALLAVKLPIRRAHWYVRPASDDPEHVKQAEFIQWNLMEGMSMTWDHFLRQSLLHLDFGNMVFEKVFEVKPWEGREMITWRKFGPRLPRTIHKWQMENGGNGVQQRLIDGTIVNIPIEKLIIFTHDMEGDNWAGRSILRAAYKHWYFKDKFYLIDAMAFEKHGLGVPKGKAKEGYTMTDDDQKATVKVLENLRAHHQAYIIEPDNVEVDYMDMKANSLRDPETSIMHHNREITKSVLAQFLELGATASGSRSLSEDHSELFTNSLEAMANNVKETLNRHAVHQLIDLNFEGVAAYPTLEYTGISKTDVEKLANAYNTLVGAGAVIADDEDERYFRELLNLPEREIQEGEERTKQKQPTDDIEEEPKDEEEFSETSKKKLSPPLSFAEQNEYWRPLTFAEKKVNLKGLQREIERLESSLIAKGSEILNKERQRFTKALAAALSAGDAKTAEKLKFQAANTYASILRQHERDAFTYGKNGAAKEIGVKAPGTPSEKRTAINMQAQTIANSQTAQIEAKSKIAAAEVLNKGGNALAAAAAADAAIDKAIKKLLKDTAGIAMAGYINHGRNHTFEVNDDRIYGKQRSEILDSRVCPYCAAVDGRVLEKDDPYTKNTIFHSGCRGYWAAILLDEAEKPDITGLPQDLRNRFGDEVNDLLQPRKKND